MGEATTLDGIPEIEEIQDSISQSFNRFKNFDVTYAPPHDHHFSVYPRSIDRQFLGGFRRANAIDQSDQLSKKIEQEREILRDNLSNSIFVRAYEGRRELMRVLIIGSKGTNLAHHLFFFDILFPRVYPSKPPFIFDHYSNSSLDLNRGLLYDTNYIIDGLKFKWDPQTSNIYHMLEFIQGYVLRLSKIYANDDERDFLVSHNALLGILRSPPKEFEDFVKGYFRKFAHAILMSMKLTGNLSESEAKTKLYFELLEAFEANGSYCKHLRHGIESIRSTFPQQKINGDVFVVKMFKRALSKTEACICWLCGNRQYCSIS